MPETASPTDPRVEASVLRDAANQLERVNARVPGGDSQGIDYAVEYLRDLADRKAAAAADTAADTVPVDRKILRAARAFISRPEQYDLDMPDALLAYLPDPDADA